MILLDQAGAGKPNSELLPPPRAIERFVEHFWLQYNPPDYEPLWRVVPEANPNLIVTLYHHTQSGERIRCVVVGPRSRFADVSLTNRVLTCGFRLLPGTLPLLAAFPASDFADRGVSVADVFGKKGGCLIERVSQARSVAEILTTLTGFLCKQLSGNDPPGRLPAFFDPQGQVKDVASQLGLPVRTMHARVLEQVGLPPKRLLRIHRLHRALAACRNPGATWAGIATTGGFSDQAHLIREFQDLLGETPGSWIRRLRLPISSIHPDSDRDTFPA